MESRIKIASDGFEYSFNPTLGTVEMAGGDYLLGGKHFIYIIKGESWVKNSSSYLTGDFNKDKFSPNYDEGAWIHNQLSNNPSGRFSVFQNVTWTGIPLLAAGKELLTSDVTVKLRVKKPYKQYETVSGKFIFERFTNSNDPLINDSLVFGQTYTVAYINNSQTWGGKRIDFGDSTYLPGQSFTVDASTAIDSYGDTNLTFLVQVQRLELY